MYYSTERRILLILNHQIFVETGILVYFAHFSIRRSLNYINYHLLIRPCVYNHNMSKRTNKLQPCWVGHYNK